MDLSLLCISHCVVTYLFICLLSLPQPWVPWEQRQYLTNSSIKVWLMLFWILAVISVSLSNHLPPIGLTWPVCCTLSRLKVDKQKNHLLHCDVLSVSTPSKQTLAISPTVSRILSASSNSLDVSIWKKGPFMSYNVIRRWQAREQILLLVSQEEIWLQTAVFALRICCFTELALPSSSFFQKVLTVFDKTSIKPSQSNSLRLDLEKPRPHFTELCCSEMKLASCVNHHVQLSAGDPAKLPHNLSNRADTTKKKAKWNIPSHINVLPGGPARAAQRRVRVNSVSLAFEVGTGCARSTVFCSVLSRHHC